MTYNAEIMKAHSGVRIGCKHSNGAPIWCAKSHKFSDIPQGAVVGGTECWQFPDAADMIAALRAGGDGRDVDTPRRILDATRAERKAS